MRIKKKVSIFATIFWQYNLLPYLLESLRLVFWLTTVNNHPLIPGYIWSRHDVYFPYKGVAEITTIFGGLPSPLYFKGYSSARAAAQEKGFFYNIVQRSCHLTTNFKVNDGSNTTKIWYYVKDINFLAQEPIINKFREYKVCLMS